MRVPNNVGLLDYKILTAPEGILLEVDGTRTSDTDGTDGVDEENALMNGVVTIDNIWSYIKLSVIDIFTVLL